MSPEEYGRYDAIGLAELVAQRKSSARELCEAAIQSIERRDPSINSFVLRMFEDARARSAGPLPTGPFAGVPFALKDLMAAYAGVPLTSGSRFYGDFTPERHSALVERYLDAGLVVVGKTSTSEFGLLPVTAPPRFGMVCNPWDRTRTAGGSSGGSAAAVSARLVPMASGGDGGGSIRIPASCCGIFGFKPSRGRNPTWPYVEGWEGFTQEHVLTRSVRDSAAALDVTNRPAAGNPYFTPPGERPFLAMLEDAPRPLRIAYSSEPLLGRSTHPDCRRALEQSVELLRSLGHELCEDRPHVDRRAFIQHWIAFMAGQLAAEVRQAERDVGRRARPAEFEDMVWLSRCMGEALPAGAYVEAVRALKREGALFDQFLARYDAWLCPTLGTPPPPPSALRSRGVWGALERLAKRASAGRVLLRSSQTLVATERQFDFVSYTPLANAGGQPSMSVPLSWNAAGLPIGVMFTARLGEDAVLFRLARQLEDAAPWRDKQPPLDAAHPS
ncbi:MAG TPA: amidase [Polyangiaceae bacterium]|nr:amidase [Polyangiaceae bacterium]